MGNSGGTRRPAAQHEGDRSHVAYPPPRAVLPGERRTGFGETTALLSYLQEREAPPLPAGPMPPEEAAAEEMEAEARRKELSAADESLRLLSAEIEAIPELLRSPSGPPLDGVGWPRAAAWPAYGEEDEDEDEEEEDEPKTRSASQRLARLVLEEAAAVEAEAGRPATPADSPAGSSAASQAGSNSAAATVLSLLAEDVSRARELMAPFATTRRD